MITTSSLVVKRIFDFILSIVLIPILLAPLLLFIVIATIDTRAFGIFKQERVGQYGKMFNIYKIRTLKKEQHKLGNLDKSATRFGKLLRATKLDELPQLFNVLFGNMSFVGPRPDIKGFADKLKGNDRIILKMKPGVTGPATIKYRDEEIILAMQNDPENYNRTIIWKDKVEINTNYALNWSFYLDLKYIFKSIINH